MSQGVTDSFDPAVRVYGDLKAGLARRLNGPLDRAVEDCRWFASIAQQARLDSLWRELAPSWESFCEQYLRHLPEFVDAVIAGIKALGLLHPDRAPADRRERFARGFDVVRKLDTYIQAVKA
jgi:hypothetical protein